MILVAEDDPFVRDTFSSILHQLGYEVVVVADGLALLDKWRTEQRRVRLIITDNDMPGRSGIDCSRVLRDEGVPIPIIITTGTLDDAVKVPHDGKTLVVRKPFHMDELAAVVERLLQAGGSSETDSAAT